MNLRVTPAGALAPGRVTQAGQVSRGGPRLKGLPDPPGWGVGCLANHPNLQKIN